MSLTLFEEIHNLWEAYEQLSRTSSSVINAAVARTYFLEEFESRKMTIIAPTAIRLPEETLQALGSFIIAHHPDLLHANTVTDGKRSSISFELRSQGDFRACGDLVKPHSLHSCSPFMSAKNDPEVEGQIQTLYSARNICKPNGFRTTQNTEFTQQYKRTFAAQNEKQKFFSYMLDHNWPDNTEVTKIHLLRSIPFHGEIKESLGKFMTCLYLC